MYGEDFYLDSFYEDRFEFYDDEPSPYSGTYSEGGDDYWFEDDEDEDRDVDDSFPMYLEYEGPFGLSGYDEY